MTICDRFLLRIRNVRDKCLGVNWNTIFVFNTHFCVQHICFCSIHIFVFNTFFRFQNIFVCWIHILVFNTYFCVEHIFLCSTHIFHRKSRPHEIMCQRHQTAPAHCMLYNQANRHNVTLCNNFAFQRQQLQRERASVLGDTFPALLLLKPFANCLWRRPIKH